MNLRPHTQSAWTCYGMSFKVVIVAYVLTVVIALAWSILGPSQRTDLRLVLPGAAFCFLMASLAFYLPVSGGRG